MRFCSDGGQRPRCRRRPSPAPDALGPTSGLAEDAAEILERDYDIDAGEVLSMNIDTVETSGVDASSPDFAEAVDKWETYGQKTFSACFATSTGAILGKRDPSISDPTTLGYYEDVKTLPEDGVTPEEYYITTKRRNPSNMKDENGNDIGGRFLGYTVQKVVPAGTKVSDLLDPNGEYGLSGSVYSRVNGGVWYANDRPDYNGWWGTGLFNPDEYGADNLHASFTQSQGGNLNEGFAFMVSKSATTYSPIGSNGQPIGEQAYVLSGYFITLSNHDLNSQYKNQRVLWKFENWRLDNSFSAPGSINNSNILWCYPVSDIWKFPGASMTSAMGEKVTCLATWSNDAKDIDYDITCKDGNIQVKETKNGQTRTVADVNDSTYTKGTYGFWGSNCEMADESLITNLNVAITKTKSFGDIVYEPEWTDGALHMLINMDTKADSTMLGTDGGPRL